MSRYQRRFEIVTALCLVLAAFSLAAVVFSVARPRTAGSYQSCRRMPVAGRRRWDYLKVDPDAHRIYVSRGTHMMVVDEVSGKVIGDIPDTKGVHGMALAPDWARASPAMAARPTVTVFDLKTLKPIGEDQDHRRKSGLDHLRSGDQARFHVQRAKRRTPRRSTRPPARWWARWIWAASRRKPRWTARATCS